MSQEKTVTTDHIFITSWREDNNSCCQCGLPASEHVPQTTTQEAFTIIVNGTTYNYPPRLPATYDNIFYLAHPDYKGVPPDGASITYRWYGEQDCDFHREGILTRDKPIYAENGMSFNCYMTGNS